MAKQMVSVTDIEQCLSSLPDDADVSVLIENIQALCELSLVPCKECPSYIRMDGGTFPGRCKRLGFWFPESFSCGYCESNGRKKRMRF